MYKFIIAILLAVFLLFGCHKEPNDPEENLTNSIDGWEITKSSYDFDINPRDIYFVNANIGYVVGYNGDIYKTTNSGQTWMKKNSGTTLHLFSVFFLNENVGFVSSQASSGCLDADCDKGCVLLKTTDGGDFPIFKGSICYETKNGGENWSTSELQKSLYLGLTFFPQRNLGYGFNLSEFCTIKKKE